MRDSSAEDTQNKTPKMALFLSLIIPKIEVFPPKFTPRVTLVTAKKQHRCWKARAYARMYARDVCA